MTLADIDPFVRGVSMTWWTTLWDSPEASMGYDCRMIGIRSGLADFTAEGKSYRLESGALVLINTGQAYHFSTVDGQPFSMYIINFDLTHARTDVATFVQPGKVSDFDPAKIIDKVDIPELCETIVLSSGSEYVPQIREMYDEYHGGQPYASRRLSAMLTDLVIRICRTSGSGNSGHKQLVAEIRHYIHENFRAALTNESIAAAMGYHPYYLSRVFREEMGTTLHRYLLDVRLTEAAYALSAHPDVTVESVAEACGFATAAHFTAAFKKKFGRLPSSFRVK